MFHPLARTIFAVSLIFTLATPAAAIESALFVDDDATKRAMQTLRNAKVFEGVAVGYSGSPSAGVTAYRTVFATPNAAERFAELANTGGTVARLYAAIGLRAHAPAQYLNVVASLRLVEHTAIETQFGCLSGAMRIGDLLERRGDNVVRLRQGQSLEDWLNKNGAGIIDIIGGGYTSRFASEPAK